MRQGKIYLLLFWLMVSTFSYALVMPYLQDNRTRKRTQNTVNTQQKQLDKQAKNGAQDKEKSSKISVSAQPFKVEDDTIPDSLLNTRWKIQLTQPYSLSDLYQSPLDLQRPDNMKYDVVYNDTLNRFVIGNRMGNTSMMVPSRPPRLRRRTAQTQLTGKNHTVSSSFMEVMAMVRRILQHFA